MGFRETSTLSYGFLKGSQGFQIISRNFIGFQNISKNVEEFKWILKNLNDSKEFEIGIITILKMKQISI